MASTNVITIPLYNKGYLNATGYREGCGFNTKIFWGSKLLSSAPCLAVALGNAYVGARLYSPKFHDWMTHEIRLSILKALEEMGNLIEPRTLGLTPPYNEGLIKNLRTGMKWYLGNKLNVTLGNDVNNPSEVITMLKEEFFKSESLLVHIELLSDFKADPKNDILNVSLSEDTKGKALKASVGEGNLPIHLFGRDWTNKAVNMFNSFKRISTDKPVTIHPTIEETRTTPPYISKGDNGLRQTYGTGTGDVVLDLKPKTGDMSISLLGNTISMINGSVEISAPKIELANGYFNPGEEKWCLYEEQSKKAYELIDPGYLFAVNSETKMVDQEKRVSVINDKKEISNVGYLGYMQIWNQSKK